MPIMAEELKKLFHFHFTKYCQQTSLHGWQYLASEDSKWKKVIWLFVLLFSFATAISLFMYHLVYYLNANPVTNIESTTASLDDVTFPTMHICNINQLRQVRFFYEFE